MILRPLTGRPTHHTQNRVSFGNAVLHVIALPSVQWI